MSDRAELEELRRLEELEARAAATPQRSKAYDTALKLGRGFLQGGVLGLTTAGVGEAMDNIDRQAESAGAATTDVLAKVLPAEAAAVGGTAVKMAPAVLGGGVGKAAGQPIVEKGSKWVMQQAVVPTSKALQNGQAYRAIDTMLENGIQATTAGAARLREMVSQLKSEVSKRIATSPEMVNKGFVQKELTKLMDEVSAKGTGYNADSQAVAKAWSDFKNHPSLQRFFETDDMISMQAADKMKRASQKAAEQSYGSLTAPTTADASQQAIARGLKKGMNNADEVIAAKNAKISEYMNALNVLEPRAAMQANKQMAGLAPAAETAEGAMLMLADRNPWLKSYVAKVLYDGRRAIPGGAGAIAGGSGPYQSTESGQ